MPAIIVAQNSENIHSMIFEKLKDQPTKELFKIFHSLNNKSYELNSEEGIRRYKIFKNTLKEIEEHRAKPNQSYTLGVTSLADLTDEEAYGEAINSYPSEFKAIFEEKKKTFLFDDYVEDEDDVVQSQSPVNKEGLKGTYPPVDWSANIFSFNSAQSSCSSGNYISAGIAIEAAYNAHNKSQVKISPQGRLDCGTEGCKSPDFTQGYVSCKNNFFATTDYPWTGVVGKCNKNINTAKAINPSEWETAVYFTNRTTDDVIATLNRGPFIFLAGFYVNKSYTGGVLTPAQNNQSGCSGSNYNALPVVGYGIDPKTQQEYFKIAYFNGSSFGESGFIRILRNDTGQNYGINCTPYARPVFP